MGVFHAYDIRGVVPDELNEEFFYVLGRHVPSFLGVKSVVVGRDMRLSSESLRDALVKGLNEAGADVADVGVVSTPCAYFAHNYLGVECSLMITASHNPAEYNGLKIQGKGGVPVGMEQGLGKLQILMQGELPEKAENMGSVREVSVEDAYIEAIIGGCDEFPFSVVIDQGHSSGTAERVAIERLTKESVCLNGVPDGSFPVHGPNPLEDGSVREVQELVKSKNAHFGVVFDGDVDRVVFVDERSRVVPSDLVIALLARTYEGGSVVVDVRSSKSVIDSLEKNGFIPVRGKAGRTFIIHHMNSLGAVLGGEKSGHYMFSEWGCKECVGVAVRKVMEVMLDEDKTLGTLIDEISTYTSMPEKNYRVKDPDVVLARLLEVFSDATVERVDGLTITLQDGSWCNIRQSNTEKGLLRLNVEAPNSEALTAFVRALEEHLH